MTTHYVFSDALRNGTVYQTACGQWVHAWGSMVVTINLISAHPGKARSVIEAPDPERALVHAYDLDKLAIHIEQLLRERAHISETLTAFYRSELSISSVQSVLDLCVELNPALDEGPR
jgi:hypothetical protein